MVQGARCSRNTARPSTPRRANSPPARYPVGALPVTAMRGGWICCVLFLGGCTLAQAQLAITEVMAASRSNTNSGFRGTEFWELTNFGTNHINLHGYGFRDSNPFRALRTDPFFNLIIRAGESIIFFRPEDQRSPVHTLEDFKAWWG